MAGRRDRLLLGAFFLSGCAALGYEILWTRLLALSLGHETMGVLGTLAGFFGGMALGSALFHDRVRRAADPARVFAVLETVAAGWALLSPHLLHALSRALPGLLGPTMGDNDSLGALSIAIAVAGITLLPATACMGATLAALVEARRRSVPEPHGRAVGLLYAVNTFGATVGVLVTVHIVLPRLAIPWASVALAAVGLTSAGLALRWSRLHGTAAASPDESARAIDTSRDPDPDVVAEPWPLLLLLFGSGLMGVGLEAVGVQVLAQVFENTIYTFADVLAIYLVGTATGAWLYSRRADRAIAGRPAMVAAAMLVTLAVTTVVAALAAVRAPAVIESIAPAGSSWTAHMIAEAVAAALVFGPATVAMGALFAHTMGLMAARGVGRAYAVNTLGCALAPFVFGLWAVERFGYRDGLFAVVWGYLLLFGAFTWLRRFRPIHQIAAIIGVLALTAAAPASLVLVEPDDGWTMLARHETPMGLVIVSEQPKEQARKGGEPLRRLQVGRHFRMGGALAFGERRMGQLPLLLHPEATRGLYLGIGTGSTLGAVTTSQLEHVDAVELVPAVLGEIGRFAAINGNVHEDPRVTLRAADARRFVAASREQWDVVVADLFHPAIDGAGGLYAREHFAAIAQRLPPGGLFAQWLPLYQLDRETLRTIVRTFCDVFPETHAWLGIYNAQTPAIALVGRTGDEPLRIDVDVLDRRLQAPIFTELLMQDPRDLLAAYIADREVLLAFAGEGPHNTDLQPWVLLHAPRLAYEGGKTAGADNLRELFAIWHDIPDEIVVGEPERRAAVLDGASAFAEALRAYLEGEILRVQASAEAAPSSEQIEHYLRAYTVAPEFVPARGMLYQLAAAWPDRADAIFERMSEVTPAEPRVWQAWLESLRRKGDRARFEEIRERAGSHLSGK